MEKLSNNGLIKIFKMSTLCNILPYYGYLHRWRILLDSINKKTYDIWRQNKNALIYLGRDFKEEIEINGHNLESKQMKLKNIQKSWLNLFSYSINLNEYISSFNFSILIDKLDENEVLIISNHNDVFKRLEIHFCDSKSVSDILPAIKCPSYKSDEKVFTNSDMRAICKYIRSYLGREAVEIKKFINKVSVRTILDPTLKLYNEREFDILIELKFYKSRIQNESCNAEDCVCKRKRVRVLCKLIHSLCKEIYHYFCGCRIEDMLIEYESYFSCKDQYNSAEILEDKCLKNYMILFDFKSKAIEGDNPRLVYSGEQLNAIDDSDLLIFSLTNRKIDLKYAVLFCDNFIENLNEDCIAMGDDFDIDLPMRLEKVHEINSTSSEFLQNISVISQLERRIYFVFSKNDLTLKVTSNNIANSLKHLNLCSKVDIKIDCELKPKTILEILDYIPQHLDCRLEINEYGLIKKLMKHHESFTKLEEKRIRFLFDGIEISLKKINCEEEEKIFDEEVCIKYHKRPCQEGKCGE